MKKNQYIIRLAIFTFFFTSCASGHLYYKEIPRDTPIAGDIALASFQLRSAPIRWSESSGNIITTYTLKFESPEKFFLELSKNLDQRIIDCIRVETINNDIIDKNKRRTILEYIPYTTLDGLIPVIDEKMNPGQMDMETLKILNTHIDADYYIVFDGDITEYELPTLLNFFEFSLTYEISVVIYDRNGNKIYSHHYNHRYQRIPRSMKDASVYYDYLSNTIILFSEQINADLVKVILPANSGLAFKEKQ